MLKVIFFPFEFGFSPQPISIKSKKFPEKQASKQAANSEMSSFFTFEGELLKRTETGGGQVHYCSLNCFCLNCFEKEEKAEGESQREGERKDGEQAVTPE